MTIVLGIDAAWTAGQPSGVAVVAGDERRPRVLGAAPSYQSFLALAAGEPVCWRPQPGMPPPVPDLIGAAVRLTGRPVDVIAIDMPLGTAPILSRRPADNAISCAFGAAGCSTHSPSPLRPGPVGQALATDLTRAGFRLATMPRLNPGLPAFIEVYPHVALLRLCGSARRLPYKVSRSGRYWPDAGLAERKRRLIGVWRGILDRLDQVMEGAAAAIPLERAEGSPTLAGLKPFEDALDAIVCAWVGCCFAGQRADGYGDTESTIWIPRL